MSPDGEAIVTGAGDETLRFWNVFSKMRSTKVITLFIFHLRLNVRLFLRFSRCVLHATLPYLPPPTPPLLGVCVSAESLHQDPVVSTPLHYEGTKAGREFVFACITL